MSDKFDALLDKLVSTAEALGVAENARRQAEARELTMKHRLAEREAEITKLNKALDDRVAELHGALVRVGFLETQNLEGKTK